MESAIGSAISDVTPILAAIEEGDPKVEEADLACASDDDQLLAVNEALDKLEAQNKAEAELVKLRYFVGMTLEEAAEVLGISARSADNYWAHARAWLFRELKAR